MKYFLHNLDLVATIFIAVIIVLITYPEMGPDATLYWGLAENLHNGRGFINNIRNDNLLPPIGHVLILLFFKTLHFNAILATKTLLVISSLLWLSIIRTITKNLVSRLFLFCVGPFSILIIWPIIPAGVEVSILSSNLLIISILSFFDFSKKAHWIFLSFALSISLIIRPMLLPLISMTIPLSIVFLLFKRYRSLSVKIILSFSLTLLLIFALSRFSNYKYGDSRLTTGTYSSIPLYVAFNPFINLQQNYASERFALVHFSLSEQEQIKKDLYIPFTSWQERDRHQKKQVLNFIIANPIKAFKGYLWRLNKISGLHMGDRFYSVFCLLFFLFPLIFLYQKRMPPLLAILSFAITIYAMLIQAVFVYVGVRYLVSIIPWIIWNIVLIINSFIEKKIGDEHA